MSQPKYRLHKPSGRAVVAIKRKSYYLGVYGSPESHAEYQRIVADHLGNGVMVPSTGKATTVAMLASAYLTHHAGQHRGKPNGVKEIHRAATAIGVLLESFGDKPATAIGARALTAVQESMARRQEQWSSRYVGKLMTEIRRCWKWAVARELAEPSTLAAFGCIERPRGHNPPPRLDVVEADVLATVPHLREPFATAAQVHWLTGMRPEELVSMRVEEIDRSAAVWVYRPTHHKSKWRRQGREILLGPSCQELIATLIGRRTKGPVFRSQTGGRYLASTYTHAVAAACSKSGVKWTPYSIRHAAFTRFSAAYGPDIARRLLGHKSLAMAERYDHMDLTKAAEIVAKCG